MSTDSNHGNWVRTLTVTLIGSGAVKDEILALLEPICARKVRVYCHPPFPPNLNGSNRKRRKCTQYESRLSVDAFSMHASLLLLNVLDVNKIIYASLFLVSHTVVS